MVFYSMACYNRKKFKKVKNMINKIRNYFAQRAQIQHDNYMRKRGKAYAKTTKDIPSGATIFFGDSITELCQLEDFYSDFSKQTGSALINRGISGESTLTMTERFVSNVCDAKPRNLVMLMGVNDIATNRMPKKINENIFSMIDEIRKLSPDTNVVLQAIYPVDEKRVNSSVLAARGNKVIREANAIIEKTAKEKGVTFIDLTKELSDENGVLIEEYSDDGLHMNANSYKVISKNIIPLLK